MERPLMIWDGDCGFCRTWIERWKVMTQGGIEYAPYQEVGGRFPQIPTSAFEKGVHLVEPDGRITRGAEAVFRALRGVPRLSWLSKAYDRVPGFAGVTEFGYRLIESNRYFFSHFI